jgi:hypothetical protein
VRPSAAAIAALRESLPASCRDHLEKAISKIVHAKQRGGRVVVVTGSGPNLHEGVTTQIAELIQHGLIDGVITSSAVVAHEMAGTLDRVKRIRIESDADFEIPIGLLPRGRIFEINQMPDSQRHDIEKELPQGWDMYDRLSALPGSLVIKAAGNMAWPMGLRTERLAQEIRNTASQYGVSLEF